MEIKEILMKSYEYILENGTNNVVNFKNHNEAFDSSLQEE